MSWISGVLHFWFGELSPADWFKARPELDALIRDRFGSLRQTLKADPPDPAALDGAGHVAAVIVLDQFSRNIFRGQAEAFAADSLALQLALHALDHHLDRALALQQRQFLYMPFMHAEDKAMQEKSLALFTALGDPGALRAAEAHKAAIDRFGRFPHRNLALGRVSTDQEMDFIRKHPDPWREPAPPR